jgi:hypothetical protein
LIVSDVRGRDETERVEKALEEMYEAAIAMGGTLSARKMSAKGILFDLYGTLIDIETDEFMEEVYCGLAHFLIPAFSS